MKALRLLRRDEPLIVGPRLTVTVTEHALIQARARYGDYTLTLADVLADVAAALRDGRTGARTPDNALGAQKGSQLAWTASHDRVYVLSKSRKMRGHVIVTALPSRPAPRYLHAVNGVTAVATAFARARGVLR